MLISFSDVLLGMALALLLAPAVRGEDVRYATHIKALFDRQCAGCHGGDAPEYGDFKKDKEKFTQQYKGPKMDSYAHLVFFTGWPDTGALMRRLDDGKGAFLPLAQLVHAQVAGPGELPAIDAAARAAIVDSITAVIDSVNVLEEPARRIVAGLRQNLAAGQYEELSDPATFARRLFQDAQAINHDGHFQIAVFPPLAQEVRESQKDEDPADVERRRRSDRAMNYGFKKAEIMPGGVGYLRFDNFMRARMPLPWRRQP